MNEAKHAAPGADSLLSDDRGTPRISRQHFARVQHALAEEKARVLWQSLGKRYSIPTEQEARFVADKTADFLRTVTNKDRQDIMDAMEKDLRRREHGRPAVPPSARAAAAWTNRWRILISGLNA